MAANFINDTDVLRLASKVNALRGAGMVPSGGLLFNKGNFFQLMVTGDSAVTYTIIAEPSDTAFQTKANIVSGLGAFALGAALYMNGYFIQAFGDMAGSGGGGGSLPDGDTVDQTIQWDGTAWQPGIIPADEAYFGLETILTYPAPAIKSAPGSPLPAVIIGDTTSGIYFFNAAMDILGNIDASVAAGVALSSGTGASISASDTTVGLTTSGPGAVTVSPTEARMVAGDNIGVRVGSGAFTATDDGVSCGSASQRWTEVFANTGTINTSDATYKTAPLPITDAVLDAVGDIDFVSFKMLAAIAEKGEANARTHFGVIAQQVLAVFASRGLNAYDYGVLCYDEWEATPALYTEAKEDIFGNVTPARLVQEARPSGSMMSVRYDELQCLNAAYLRRELAKLVK